MSKPDTNRERKTLKSKRPVAGMRARATIVAAIKNKEVLRFIYNDEERAVEPQTYGISTAGHEVLRARQVGGDSRSGSSGFAKLFDVEKMSDLKTTGTRFEKALAEHNPEDTAMVKVFVSLPRPNKH
jgi:hypothetical protein